MPIVLDDSIDPSLYPLAWLVGAWEGEGAVQLPGPDGSPVGRRIEQRVTIAPNDSGALEWHMTTWVLDAPAPQPPTNAFYEDAESPAEVNLEDPESQIVREQLLEERALWRVSGPLPGQDEQKAAQAKPGSQDAYLSHGVSVQVQRTTGFGVTDAEEWVGEVRGPRVQLACKQVPSTTDSGKTLEGTRMFGLVGGNLMWLQEVGENLSDLSPYLSVELHRAADDPAGAEDISA